MSSITKTIRLSGKAGDSIEDAVRTVLARAASTISDIQKFEIVKVGGVVELSNDDTLPPGVFAWFQAIDYGQGNADPADESTLVGFGDEAANEAFCNSPATPRFGPWPVRGNLQVD